MIEADIGADDEDNDVEPLTPNPSQVTLSESCMSTTSDLCAETDCSQNAKERKKKRRAEVQLLLEYTRDMFHRLCMKEKHLQCLVCNSHTENGIEQRTRKKSKTKETDKSVQEELGRVLESLGSVLCKRLLCLDRRVLRGVMCRSKEGYPLLTGTNQRRKKKIQTRKRRGNLQLLLESSGNLLSQRLRCLDGRSLKGLISKPKAGRKHRAGQDKKAKPDNAVKIGTKRKKQELELSEPSQSNATGNKEEHPRKILRPKRKSTLIQLSYAVVTKYFQVYTLKKYIYEVLFI
ncbi:uncharacterized protein LOC121384304 [Gigantopelta aegis]|uniref:uncharacterized protein LOC121384304 n=1 Tax=Gigantopelta aegis TaxID=1735272 RepID=UPI001B88CE5B|nr:uncharacterized protein LOC121384304 [Gigantopelta aegis]